MTGAGTLLNIATVAAGGSLGLLLRRGLPERFRRNVLIGLGLATLLLGVKSGLETLNILYPIGAILLGGLCGELLRIEDRLDALGRRVEKVLGRGGDGLTRGFVTASLLFCVGPLTIWGSMEDGLGRGYQVLAVKSLLDGFASMALASTLGAGVLLSVVTIAVIQGGITWLAGPLEAVLSEAMVAEISAVGGLLVMAIGFTLMDVRKIPVANYLPALFFAPLLVWIVSLM